MPTESPALAPVLQFLRRHAPFDQMAAGHLEFLSRHLKLAFYTRGEVVLGPEEQAPGRFYIVKQGRVRGEAPSEQPVADEGAWELVAGECFPVGALLARRPVRTVTRAVEDSFCFELDRTHFDQLLARSPVFNDFCTRRLASLLDLALRGAQASSATSVSGDSLGAPLRTLVRRVPVTCTRDTPIGTALTCMERERIGSIVIADEAQRPIGVFTLNDVLSRIALPERDLGDPIGDVMTPSPVSLPPDALAYQAARLMAQNGFSHVCVVAEGRLVGVISERDLFSLRRVGLVSLARDIGSAPDLAALAMLERDVQRLVEQMLAQGVPVEHLTQILTALNDHLTRRVIVLCEAAEGRPEAPYAWLAFGSEGRGEQTLKTDQDNGIVFALPAGRDLEQVRAQLLALGRRVNEALAQVGFPLCRRRVMAGNPDYCLSLDEWRARFARWIHEGSAQQLLGTTVCFDFRPVYGESALADELRRWLAGEARDKRASLRRLVENALRNRSPLGLVRDFAVDSDGEHPNTLDLKLTGVIPFTDAARIFALAAGITETNTLARLRETGKRWEIPDATVEAWVQAFLFLQLLRLRQQHGQAQSGQPPHNRIDPDALSDLERRILKEAFRQSRKLQSTLEKYFQF
jgi:CBS domain-containing protein